MFTHYFRRGTIPTMLPHASCRKKDTGYGMPPKRSVQDNSLSLCISVSPNCKSRAGPKHCHESRVRKRNNAVRSPSNRAALYVVRFLGLALCTMLLWYAFSRFRLVNIGRQMQECTQVAILRALPCMPCLCRSDSK